MKSWVIMMASTVAAAALLIITATYASRHSRKKKSTLSINIDNTVDRQPPSAPESTFVNMATNTAVYVVTDPGKEGTKQEEVPNSMSTSLEEAAHALEIEKTKKWLESL